MSHDLAERLRRAVARLEELRDRPGQGRYEKVRLDGKIDGVKLAASYLEEGTRIFSPEAEPANDALAEVTEALAEASEVTSETSDGYHTFAELYEYRMLYNAHAAQGWLAAGFPVVKSWNHSDGEPCFGGDWFIVTATLPTGQVSNHYKAEYWGLFDVPEVSLPPEYDGHTPHDVAVRLGEALRNA